jgi:hypothetical protein
MFFLVRLVFIFLFGIGMAKTIEDSPAGALVMGAISVLLTIWLVIDVSNNPQYYKSMFSMIGGH